MVATPPDKVYRLNQSDLVEMGVQIIEPSVDKPSPEPSVDKPSSLTYTSRPGWKNANGEDCREYKFTKGNFETMAHPAGMRGANGGRVKNSAPLAR
jgi:hypothetical protein